MAAALGIRREDSLDSDDFPHDSSCDSHPHEDSGDSSSEEGTDEKLDDIVPVSELMKAKCDIVNSDMIGDKDLSVVKGVSKVKYKKSKENLTTDKVNEIEEVKNSVSEWIESVNNIDTSPVAESISKIADSIELPVAAGTGTGLSHVRKIQSDHHQKSNPSPKLPQYESHLEGPISLSGQYPVNSPLQPSQQHYMTNTPTGFSTDILVQQKHLEEKLAQYHADALQSVEKNPSFVQQPENHVTKVHDTSNNPSQLHLPSISNVPIPLNPAIPSLSWSAGQENPSGRVLPGPSVIPPNIGPQTNSDYPANMSPVSALSILNTDSASLVGTSDNITTGPFPGVSENLVESKTPTPLQVSSDSHFHVGSSNNYDKQQTMMPVQPPPGFQVPFNTYQMFPPDIGTTATPEGLKKDSVYPSSKFIEKLVSVSLL